MHLHKGAQDIEETLYIGSSHLVSGEGEGASINRYHQKTT